MKQLLVLFLVIGVITSARGADIREVDYAGKRTGLVIDSPLLRVGIVPSMGGRIVEFVPKAVEKNYLHRAPWFYHLGPKDAWDGAEYGGICDAPTSGWPGPFWGMDYRIERLQEAGMTGLRATAEAEGIGIQREMLVPEGSTRLIVRVKQSNLSDDPKKMTLRVHGEFRVGAQADDQDFIFWRDGDTLKTRQYIPGSESPRLYFDNPTENWMAMVDTVEREALIHRYLSPTAPYRVFFWSGHPSPPPGSPESTGDTGFYNNERFIESKDAIAPRGTMEAVEEFWALRGLSRVDFCVDEGAGALDFPRARYGHNDTVALTCAFGAPMAGTPVQVAVTVQDANGQPVGTLQGRIPAFSAGEIAQAQITFATKTLPDGAYTVTVVYSRDGKVLGQAVRTFAITAELVNRAQSAVSDLDKRVNVLKKAWGTRNQSDRLRIQVLQVRIGEVRQALERGEYEAVLTEAAEINSAITRVIEDRQRERTEDIEQPVDLKSLLKRYGGAR
jgi:hypothetical protein